MLKNACEGYNLFPFIVEPVTDYIRLVIIYRSYVAEGFVILCFIDFFPDQVYGIVSGYMIAFL